MDARTYGADRGIGWLQQGWRLFAASPGMWIVLAVILMLVLVALNLVPFIGVLIGQILAPALSGGLLLAARDAEAGRPLDLGRLFEPLVAERSRGDILILGLLYMGAYIATMAVGLMVLVVTVGMSAFDAALFADPERMDPSVALSMGIGLMVAVMVWLVLGLVVMALFFYAIPLVVLGQLPPTHAIALGLRGLLRNWLPLLVLGLIWTVLAILATVPLLLGWLVLGPLTWTAWYASYREIFEPETEDDGASTQTPPPREMLEG